MKEIEYCVLYMEPLALTQYAVVIVSISVSIMTVIALISTISNYPNQGVTQLCNVNACSLPDTALTID